MSRQINQPINQVKLTNVAVVRYNYSGKRFEIACYKNKVIDYRNGLETDLSEVLQSERIFVNVSKGEFAKTSDLLKAFHTKNEHDIAKIILEKGNSIQVSDLERNHIYEQTSQKIAVWLSENCINGDTDRPYTVHQVKHALAITNYQVQPHKPIKKQYLDAYKFLKSTNSMNIVRCMMELSFVYPSEHDRYVQDQIRSWNRSNGTPMSEDDIINCIDHDVVGKHNEHNNINNDNKNNTPVQRRLPVQIQKQFVAVSTPASEKKKENYDELPTKSYSTGSSATTTTLILHVDPSLYRDLTLVAQKISGRVEIMVQNVGTGTTSSSTSTNTTNNYTHNDDDGNDNNNNNNSNNHHVVHEQLKIAGSMENASSHAAELMDTKTIQDRSSQHQKQLQSTHDHDYVRTNDSELVETNPLNVISTVSAEVIVSDDDDDDDDDDEKEVKHGHKSKGNDCNNDDDDDDTDDNTDDAILQFQQAVPSNMTKKDLRRARKAKNKQILSRIRNQQDNAVTDYDDDDVEHHGNFPQQNDSTSKSNNSKKKNKKNDNDNRHKLQSDNDIRQESAATKTITRNRKPIPVNPVSVESVSTPARMNCGVSIGTGSTTNGSNTAIQQHASTSTSTSTSTSSCNTCGGEFLTSASYRAHFRSDWHRFNQKLKLQGCQPVSESEFLACDATTFFDTTTTF